MLVTYIQHSSFLVETKSCYLLFDYFGGKLPDMDEQKALYVFASHKHGDHYSKDIFGLSGRFSVIHYILSKDIKHHVPEEFKETVAFVKPYERYEVGSLTLETLRSTDEGVAYLVSVEDRLIYHAGDLNCWMWEAATKAENNNIKKLYLNEMERMTGRKIFMAFVPLDPRLGQYFDLGLKYFFENAEADYIFPMHMWEDYKVIERLKTIPFYETYKESVVDIHASLEQFDLDVR